MAVAKEKKKPW
ncbi:Protein of unknown function [Bacillus cereus]|nr:Protein of unknown function [Bacillus cereus]